ncbi:MAG: ribonuclease Z [Flavobacteriaceae bacterium]|nr:ribonuclease Z [Flavobacteriaceae bacterium]
MSLRLTILGCHSATPRTFAHPTSQFLEINNRSFLIDCGEGTQVQLRKYKIKFSKIDNIFISHLHGDHFFGLIGLVSTFGLLNREHDLHIYGPKGIKEIIELQLKLSNSYLQFDLVFHELESKESQLIYEDDKVEVSTIPLEHRVYTNGFLFKEKSGERRLNIEAVKRNPEIEICDYQNLKNGKDFISEDGTIINNDKLTFNPPKPVSYAYCSDTMFKPEITPIIEEVDLLYHESTFLKDKEDLTGKTKHSTAEQAAMIAQKANVGKLILGHYSSRYPDISLFKEEAETIFEHVALAEVGKIFDVSNTVNNTMLLVHQN